jgi:ATP-binding cassette subfamily F protein 3
MVHCLEDQTKDALLDERDISDALTPYLLDARVYSAEPEARAFTASLLSKMRDLGLVKQRTNEIKLLQHAVVLERVVHSKSNMLSAIGAGTNRSVNVNANTDVDDLDVAVAQRKARAKKSKDVARQSEYQKFLDDRAAASQRALENLQVRRTTGLVDRDIHCEGISITMGTQKLLDKASLTLAYGRRYGLVGKNGSGKTTLLRHLADYALEGIPRALQILHVEQEVAADDRSPLQVVLAADVERTSLLAEEERLLASKSTNPADTKALEAVYRRMDELDIHSAEARAASILSGLQFSTEAMNAPTKRLSGGWRMRVALARALFVQPDVLALDEPTNMLDLSALLWLEQYLQTWSKTLLVVSHARDFLNSVCTDIIHLHSRNLHYYKGNYDMFAAVRGERMSNQAKMHEAQEKHRKHIQSYIDRFRCKAATARMAQSRIKMLERMTVVPAVIEDPTIAFNFPQPDQVPPPILQAVDISFAYGAPKNSTSSALESAIDNGENAKTDAEPIDHSEDKQQLGKPLFSDVNFGITMDSRIAIVGPNGAGKSTLLKALLGELEPQTGLVMRSPKARIGYFSQYFVDALDMQLSAVENLSQRFPGVSAQTLRGHLGQFGITGDTALQPAYTLSGGQKSRVVLAMIMYSKPHVLVADEISNHLDIETVEALIQALTEWEGGLVLVSHDQHLISSICDEIWVVEDQKAYRFDGDFEQYKKNFLRTLQRQTYNR